MHDADRERILGVEGHASDQHFVEDDTKAIEIGAAIELLAAGLLGAHVVRRADHGTRPGHARRRVVGAGDAEIGQGRGAVITQQDVVGLDVAMDESLLLRVVDRARVTRRANETVRAGPFLVSTGPPARYSMAM